MRTKKTAQEGREIPISIQSDGIISPQPHFFLRLLFGAIVSDGGRRRVRVAEHSSEKFNLSFRTIQIRKSLSRSFQLLQQHK